MNIWISKGLVALGLLAVLGGCVTGPGSPGQSRFGGGLGTPARQALVLGGAVTVTGPEGYCVDKSASRVGGETAFVLMAPCERFRRGVAGILFRPRALVTATVTEGSGPTASGYKRFFSEREGLSALSHNGNPEGVDVESMGAASDGSFRVTVTDSVAPDKNGLVDTRSWRAFFTVEGHLVAASLRSPRGAPLSSDGAQSMLTQMVAAIRQASAPPEPPETAETAPVARATSALQD